MTKYQNSDNNLFLNSPVTVSIFNYSALLSDYIIEIASTVVPRTVTLPAPSTLGSSYNVGKVLIVKDTSGGAASNNITIAPASGLIDNQASIVINTNFGYATVYCDGAGWYTSSSILPPMFALHTVSSSSYSAVVTDSIIHVTFSGNCSITLPTPTATTAGRIFIIKDANGNLGGSTGYQITVSPSGATIDGSANAFITAPFGYLSCYSDGVNYKIFSSVPSSTVVWQQIAGATASLMPGNGYILTNSGNQTVTLPLVASLGSVIKVIELSSSTGLFTIAQNAGQSIQYGAQVTTTGTGGSLVASQNGNSVSLICTTANTVWVVQNSVGNITVN